MGEVAAKMIRLVRCPKCRQVLHELPNVPVYQCGGCGAYLQAKIRALTPSASEVSASSVVHIPKVGSNDDPKSEASDQEQQQISKVASLPAHATFLEKEEMSADVGVASQAEFNDLEVDARRSSTSGDVHRSQGRLDRPSRGRGRLERDEFLPRPRSCMNGYGSGSPSYPSQRGSHFHARNDTAEIEQQKIRLLRMVRELRDQLTASCSMNDTVSARRVSAGDARKHQHVPKFRDGEALEYPKYRSDPRSQQIQHSRIPFSADATYCRHNIHQCFCCQTQCCNHNRVFCRAHSGANFCRSYGSCFCASPRIHTNSNYSTYGRTTKFNDQRHRGDYDSKNYSRETHYSVNKRHIRLAEAVDTHELSYTVDKQGTDESSEIGKVREKGRSPLHRLMGYSTLSGALRSTGTN